MNTQHQLIRELANRAVDDLDLCASFRVYVSRNPDARYQAAIGREIARLYALGQTLEGTVANHPRIGADIDDGPNEEVMIQRRRSQTYEDFGRAIEAAIKAERERCADIADELFAGDSMEMQSAGYKVADAIRGDT